MFGCLTNLACSNKHLEQKQENEQERNKTKKFGQRKRWKKRLWEIKRMEKGEFCDVFKFTWGKVFEWFGEGVCTHDQNKQVLVKKGTNQHKKHNQKEEKPKEMTSTNKSRHKMWFCLFFKEREKGTVVVNDLLCFASFFLPLSMHFKNRMYRWKSFFLFFVFLFCCQNHRR